MKAFARAARIMMDRGKAADAAVRKLAHAPFSLSDPLWRDVFWRVETKTMVNKFVRLAQNLFLHKAGEKPDAAKYDVEKEFKRITGRELPH